MPHFVIMGVSGCGKTSVGTALSDACGLVFIDGDTLHPPTNIAKMASGQPLDDTDRAPWLRDVGLTLAAAETPTLIGCSALKRRYRDWIRREVSDPVHFLHLDSSKDVLSERVAQRTDHFMPPALLDSQFAALERLEPDELGQVIDISVSLPDVVAQSRTYLRKVLA